MKDGTSCGCGAWRLLVDFIKRRGLATAPRTQKRSALLLQKSRQNQTLPQCNTECNTAPRPQVEHGCTAVPSAPFAHSTLASTHCSAHAAHPLPHLSRFTGRRQHVAASFSVRSSQARNLKRGVPESPQDLNAMRS